MALTLIDGTIIAISCIGIVVSVGIIVQVYTSKRQPPPFSSLGDVAVLVDALPGYVVIFDRTGEVRHVNTSLKRALGRDRTDRALSTLPVTPKTEGEAALVTADGAEETVFWQRFGWSRTEQYCDGVALYGRSVRASGTALGLPPEVERKLWEKTNALLRTNHSLMQSRTQLRRLVEKLYDIKEREGIRIARELHDELGQILTGLKIEVVLLARKIEKSSTEISVDAMRVLSETQNLVDQAILRVQTLSKELRPPMLDKLGLLATFQTVLNELAKQTSFQYEISHNIGDDALSGEALTCTYRIFKETATSLAARENGGTVRIRIVQADDRVRITFIDDAGIDPDALFHDDSVGLLGLTEYARKCGGTFVVSQNETSPPQIIVTIPLAVGGSNL